MGKDVQYFVPETLDEALSILAEHGSAVSVLSGGTDLVRDMNLEFKRPDALMWIGKLNLEYVRRENGTFHIGGATRMQTVGSSEDLKKHAWAVARAGGKLASPPVRSLATLGGNLCTASPAADTACALLGLDAEVVLTSKQGERIVVLREFFVGPNQTVIKPEELLTEIRVKATVEREGSSYVKQGRRQAMTLAVLNTASRVKLDPNGTVEAVSIAIGSAAPTPLRIAKAEELLLGSPLTDEAITEAANIASEEISPIDDVHGTAWYRRKLARVFVRRTLMEAAGMNGGAH